MPRSETIPTPPQHSHKPCGIHINPIIVNPRSTFFPLRGCRFRTNSTILSNLTE